MNRAILLLWVLLAAGAGRAEEYQVKPPAFPYDGQGSFVIAPAQTISAPAFQAGFMAGAFLCLPISLFQDARKDSQSDEGARASIVCGRGLGLTLGWPVYATSGLPFYLLKKMFWDGPRAVLVRPEKPRPE